VTGTLGTGTFHGSGTQTGATSFTVHTTTVYPNGILDQSEAGTDTGTGTATLDATITGGTGRFAGAIGSSTIQSTSTPSGTPGLSDFTFTSTGTITFAPGHRVLSWTAPVLIDPPPQNLNYMGLSGISCPTGGLCVVSGAFGDAVSSTDPTGGFGAWQPSGPLDLDGLLAVSCASPTLCVTGDDEGSILTSTAPTLGAGGWSKPLLIDPVQSPNQTFRGLTGVACPSALLCVVVDQFGSVLTSTHPTGGAAAWSPASDIDAGNALAGVSCSSRRLCVAVDHQGNEVTSTDPTGGVAAWTVGHVDGSNPLIGVSCASRRLCVAVDNSGNILTSTDPAAGAGTWRVSASVGQTHPFAGVSCYETPRRVAKSGPVLCVAVDGAGNAFASRAPTGGASEWQQTNVAGADPMSGVSCASLQLCVATVVYGEAVVGTG
jgi:hypothetical protein